MLKKNFYLSHLVTVHSRVITSLIDTEDVLLVAHRVNGNGCFSFEKTKS